MKKGNEANVGAIYQGHAIGDVASLMLRNGMKTNSLRTNATLRPDEWKHFDEAVVDVARQRLVGVGDLISAGLTFDLPNGMGTTVLETEDASDMSAAQLDMDGATESENDRQVFGVGYLPLPIIHKGFNINARVLASSRTRGAALDTTQAQVAAIKVAEKTEDILFNGADAYQFGTNSAKLYGYTDFPGRNTVTLDANWDASGKTGAQIVADVLEMKQSSIDDSHYGPWMLYAPTEYDTVMDEDYSTAKGDITIRDRIMKIDGIQGVKVADKLTANNIVLVQMQQQTARMVIGMQPTTLQWESKGGMLFHFKIMSIMVPQLRTDQNGKCGIIHMAA